MDHIKKRLNQERIRSSRHWIVSRAIQKIGDNEIEDYEDGDNEKGTIEMTMKVQT